MMFNGQPMKTTHKKAFNRRGAALLAVFLCLLLCTGLLAGCGGSDNASYYIVDDSDDGPTPEEEQAEKAIDGVSLGKWQDSYMLSERDDKPYPVKVRFTKIDSDPKKVQEQIDEFNVSAAGYTIPSMDSSQTYGYVIAHYEVKFPEDYPDGDYGITNVAPEFEIRGIDGSEVISVGKVNHEGLTKTFEIGYQPQGYDFHAGDTYEGAIVYLMVNGCTSYRILEIVPAKDAKDAQHFYLPEKKKK